MHRHNTISRGLDLHPVAITMITPGYSRVLSLVKGKLTGESGSNPRFFEENGKSCWLFFRSEFIALGHYEASFHITAFQLKNDIGKLLTIFLSKLPEIY